MVRNEFTFPSADGKTAIHAVEWLPEGDIAAVLQISHGVSEYILRYEPFAIWLTERGFAVIGHDHLGHGDSVAEGAPRLHFGPKGSWTWVVDDIHTLRQRSGDKFSGVPYFLLGHSMGSFLARTYLIRYPGTVNGAIIMGTGQMSPLLIAGGRLVAAMEGKRLGDSAASPLVAQLSFASYNKLFAPNRTTFDWLSVNEENVDRYIADPLCGGNASVGLFGEMLGGMNFIAKAEHLKQMDPSIPVLFISGEMDPVGDCGKGVKLAYESFCTTGVQDVSLKLYPELRHEILCEKEKELVFEDIYQWLKDKM